MTIDEKAVEILRATFPEWSVLCEDWYNADRAIEKLRPPYAVFLLPPTGGNIVTRNGRTKENENISVAFVTHVPRDANGDENLKAYNEMKDAARQYVNAINDDGFFEKVETFEFGPVFNELADIVTGIVAYITLQEARGCC
jgi:hypothetical protein